MPLRFYCYCVPEHHTATHTALCTTSRSTFFHHHLPLHTTPRIPVLLLFSSYIIHTYSSCRFTIRPDYLHFFYTFGFLDFILYLEQWIYATVHVIHYIYLRTPHTHRLVRLYNILITWFISVLLRNGLKQVLLVLPAIGILYLDISSCRR